MAMTRRQAIFTTAKSILGLAGLPLLAACSGSAPPSASTATSAATPSTTSAPVSAATSSGSIAPASAASQSAHVGVITDSENSPTIPAFRQALRNAGYAEGNNIAVEYRYFETDYGRLPGFAAELIGLKVRVIAALGAEVAKAAKQATTTVPIVFAMVPDVITAGLVTNLQRPGGNITGFSTFDPDLAKKQMQLLKDVLPGLTGVAILGDQSVAGLWNETEAAARDLGLQPHVVKLQSQGLDIPGSLDSVKKQGAGALVALSHPLISRHAEEIANLAVERRLASLFVGAPDVETGQWTGLFAYGAALADAARRVPSYIDKILKGTPPGDLPVVQGTLARLIVNQQTAQKVGVTIPQAVLDRADRVIR